MALPQQFLPAITAEQYLQLERTSEMRHEFLDGLMYVMAGESRDHSRICFNLATEIGAQLKGKHCEGFSPNMKVRAGLGGLYAYPDLMVVRGEARFQDKQGDVLLNPTVIFEVLSPSTEKYDQGENSSAIALRSRAFRITCWFRRTRRASSIIIVNPMARGV